MKKILSLIVTILISTSTLVVAQQKEQNRERQQQGKEMLEKAKAELDLNEKQSAEWDKIHQQYIEDLKMLRADESISDENRKAKAKEVRSEKDEAIKSVLTEEQFVKYNELRKEGRKQYQQKNGINARPNEGRNSSKQQLMDELKLTDEQQVKWDEIYKEYRVKKSDIQHDENIEPEDKREQMRAVTGEQNAELMALLTSEQQAIYSKHLEEMKNRRAQQSGNKGQK